MNEKVCTSRGISRISRWIKSSRSGKIHSILVRVISAAKKFDSETFRGAYFDARDVTQEFSISTNGSEKYVVINSDNAISKALFIKGTFDFDKVEKALTILASNNKTFKLETLVDVGANIGTVCIPAVKRGFAARAIAIEPEPLNYRVLVANIFLNDLADTIRTYNIALGAENDQTLELEISTGHSGDHRIYVASEADLPAKRTTASVTSVKSETFDKTIPPLDRNSCLIWMDTQGYEGIILKGAKTVLSRRVPMVIEFWPEGMIKMGSYAALREALSNYAECYDLSDQSPRAFRPTPSSLDHLYKEIGEQGRWTDILVV